MAVCCSVIASNSSSSLLTYTPGSPWAMQGLSNPSQTTDITWNSLGSNLGLPSGLSGYQVVTTKNKVHVLGGSVFPSDSLVQYTATIASDGTIGTFANSGSIPFSIGGGLNGNVGACTLVTATRVYIFRDQGGNIGYCSINADGTLGSWTNSGAGAFNGQGTSAGAVGAKAFATYFRVDTPVGQRTAQATWWSMNPATGGLSASGLANAYLSAPAGSVSTGVVSMVTNSRYYIYFGAYTGAAQSGYYATINPDSTLGTWTATGQSLPLLCPTAVMTNSRVWIFNGFGSAVVYTAPIDSNGVIGTFVAGNSIPVGAKTLTSGFNANMPVVTSSRVYLFGGATSLAYANFAGGSNYYGT